MSIGGSRVRSMVSEPKLYGVNKRLSVVPAVREILV